MDIVFEHSIAQNDHKTVKKKKKDERFWFLAASSPLHS